MFLNKWKPYNVMYTIINKIIFILHYSNETEIFRIIVMRI